MNGLIDKTKSEALYRIMVRIRKFDTTIVQLYADGEIPGFMHLYIGEEAVAAGVCAALRTEDLITSTHRSHGHCIAKGGRLDLMMAELVGRKTGYCKGKGGSMHIADFNLGILGANGIVSGGIPTAVGAAVGIQYKEDELLLTIETEKTTLDIEARRSGYLGRITVQEGDTVPISNIIGYIADSADELSNDTHL